MSDKAGSSSRDRDQPSSSKSAKKDLKNALIHEEFLWKLRQIRDKFLIPDEEESISDGVVTPDMLVREVAELAALDKNDTLIASFQEQVQNLQQIDGRNSDLKKDIYEKLEALIQSVSHYVSKCDKGEKKPPHKMWTKMMKRIVLPNVRNERREFSDLTKKIDDVMTKLCKIKDDAKTVLRLHDEVRYLYRADQKYLDYLDKVYGSMLELNMINKVLHKFIAILKGKE